MKQGIESILGNVEIKAAGKTTAPEITDQQLHEWGILFDGLDEPYRTPAFSLLREVKKNGREYNGG